MTSRHRFGFARIASFTALAYYLGLLLPAAGPWRPLSGESTAEARVNPLSLIARQIHKPNILVVLDTSGSLTGVPGGTFDTSDEVGVDCDDGENCRGGKALGKCVTSGKACYSDEDCAVDSTCKGDAMPCGTNADCAVLPGACNQTTCDSSNSNCLKASCFVSGDCPASTTGTCTISHNSCNPVSKCAATLKCTYGTASCSSTSTPCAAYAVCKNSSGGLTTQQCATDNDCPLKPTGTCSVGGATCTGSAVTSCAKVCPDHSTVCTSDSQCGVCTKGTGTLPGNYCAVKADCNSSNSSKACNVTSGSCSNNNNSCALPHYTCTVTQASNPCVDTNPCVGPANTCGTLPNNSCVGPTAGDLCNAGTTATTASRMCRITQLKCSKDSDCSTAGDSCGPATSRVVIAKRVLSSIVTKNSNIANFGLMTFYQNKYFPYYKLTGAWTPATASTLAPARPAPAPSTAWSTRCPAPPTAFTRSAAPASKCRPTGAASSAPSPAPAPAPIRAAITRTPRPSAR